MQGIFVDTRERKFVMYCVGAGVLDVVFTTATAFGTTVLFPARCFLYQDAGIADGTFPVPSTFGSADDHGYAN